MSRKKTCDAEPGWTKKRMCITESANHKGKRADPDCVSCCYCNSIELKILRTSKDRSKTLGLKRMDAGFISISKALFLGRAKEPMTPHIIIKVGGNL